MSHAGKISQLDCLTMTKSRPTYINRGDGHVLKTVRIVPEVKPLDGQAINFVLAIGSIRQMCRLQTTFRTQSQALSYLHKHRTQFERTARDRFARGEVDDGIVNLTML